MRRVLTLLAGGAVLISSLTARATREAEDGGKDVTVAIFSARKVRSLKVTPLGPNAWTAACSTCTHRRLTESLHLEAPTDVFAGGMLRVTDERSGDTQTATGLWHIRATGRESDLNIVLTLPSERYVAAVLNAEASPNEPAQSLQALAIVSRTYALNGIHFTPQTGQLPADLCDSTQCQAMRLGPVSPAIDQAVEATAGETLWFGTRRAEVFFSQSCGGTTEDAAAIWPKLRGLPYLQSHHDPYCVRRDSAAWHAEISMAELAAIAQAEGWHIPARVIAAHVAERSRSHRALRVEFTGDNGQHASVAAGALRFGVGRSLGWNRLRSDDYELGLRHGGLLFDGRGHGHGVGLCQAGAFEMASEGSDASSILAFYFPGTAVRITPRDEGWHETHFGSMTLRASELPSSDQAARNKVIQSTWDDALRRFPSQRPVAPEILLAPTTELFRQMTTQPGWVLASTRGHTIVLQPETVLARHGLTLGTLLRHEMLHALVEAEATSRAPLWLREGLVEVLAREADGAAPSMSSKQIDDALATADSWSASERAHRAAAARVRTLIARYGAPAVRRWLSAGPPAEAA